MAQRSTESLLGATVKATLPGFFKYRTAEDLVRIGKEYDGGYLISEKDARASNILIGLGVNDDWSFEKDFCLLNNVPVLAYDGSATNLFFVRKFISAFFKFLRPKVMLRGIFLYPLFKLFFRGSRRHIKKFVGARSNDNYCSMEKVFLDAGSKKIFLKIDIEGDEYSILDDLIANEEKITGLVIEFHDCGQHIEQIKSFIARLSMPLIHIHANNNAPVGKDDGLPSVLELTFSSNAELGKQCVQPHPLDMPNRRSRKEIELIFKEN